MRLTRSDEERHVGAEAGESHHWRGDGDVRHVTIVMYHYVRDLPRTRYPGIKGLRTDLFEGQIEYARRHHSIIGTEQLLESVTDGAPLPPNALLLTFDDGYADHFTDVYPVLRRHGVTGCFFPAAKCVDESVVLDVNKIHFVLASEPDPGRILARLFAVVDEHRTAFELDSESGYRQRMQRKNRYDSDDVLLIKSMLQRDLPSELRRIAIDELFSAYVTQDEAAFAQELYLSRDQIAEMKEGGMSFGSHGYEHVWLDSLDAEGQATEVDRSLTFLRSLGVDTDRWVMCYPFGGYDDTLLTHIEDRGCVAGFTTRPAVADLDADAPLLLPRLDTNDLPTSPDAPPSERIPGGSR